MVKKAPSAGASERARTLRRDMTEAERRLWQILRSRQTEGCRFRRQVPIGPFIADFVCHAAKLIVEIDGGQHDPSSEVEASRTRFLESEGYGVLRFWNNEVLYNRAGVRRAIADALHRVTSARTQSLTPTRIEPLTPTPSLPLEGSLEGGGGQKMLSHRRVHRGEEQEATQADSTDPAQLIANLRRQLAECGAERDEALAREAALAEVLQTLNSSPGGSKAGSCMSRTSSPSRTTRCPKLWRPGVARCLGCRCCATAS